MRKVANHQHLVKRGFALDTYTRTAALAAIGVVRVGCVRGEDDLVVSVDGNEALGQGTVVILVSARQWKKKSKPSVSHYFPV